jgi:hypothetical protein
VGRPSCSAPSKIPETNQFQDIGAKPTFTISLCAVLVFDTCVFWAISYKLAQTFVVQGKEPDSVRGGEDTNRDAIISTAVWAWWSVAASEKGLPRLSRAIC